MLLPVILCVGILGCMSQAQPPARNRTPVVAVTNLRASMHQRNERIKVLSNEIETYWSAERLIRQDMRQPESQQRLNAILQLTSQSLREIADLHEANAEDARLYAEAVEEMMQP